MLNLHVFIPLKTSTLDMKFDSLGNLGDQDTRLSRHAFIPLRPVRWKLTLFDLDDLKYPVKSPCFCPQDDWHSKH